MLKLGLTGGIASGKSTVSRTFKEQGVPIIDADMVAREVVEPGKPALEAIRKQFGTAVITPARKACHNTPRRRPNRAGHHPQPQTSPPDRHSPQQTERNPVTHANNRWFEA